MSKVRDDTTEVVITESSSVVIDAGEIATIILRVCDVPQWKAAHAANLILDHLIKVHQHATPLQ
jgi:hypothetical protein